MSAQLVQHWAAGDDCHSCHVRFANYPLMFANGKGATPELAYASALAEFIERLQCRADALFTRAGNIHCLARVRAPPRPRAGRVAWSAPGLSTADLGRLTADTSDVLPCLEFVDVFGERVVDLPFDALYMMTGSSGMCAGNTPEEALAHGICEVFERHVIHAARERPGGRPADLPDRRAASEERPRPATDRLLTSAGIEVLVKDATLGGVVPVVGLVLTDRAAGTCQVSFGSDPVFDVALSRCVTEAFQGTNRLFRTMIGRADHPAARHLQQPRGPADTLPRKRRDDVRREGAFGDVATSDDAMRVAMDRVRQLGRGLFVRDFSLFGFPAYYVYVESLSALKALRTADFCAPLHASRCRPRDALPVAVRLGG